MVKNVQELIDQYNDLVDKRSDYKHVISKIREERITEGEPLSLLEQQVDILSEKIQELLNLKVQVVSESPVLENPLNPKK